jgi:molybdenum-dependent DNA-binding transcriptional regulator ModE
MHRMTPKTRLSIRIDSVVGKIGAKQIAFFEAIQSQGSITGAGRFTGLSYPGARLMIDAINKVLRKPAVRQYHDRWTQTRRGHANYSVR